MAVNGIDLITPTSIAHSSGSASINAGGSVTYTGVSAIRLNGVFSSAYDNYMIVVRDSANTNLTPLVRLRAAGSDNATSNSYTSQSLIASSTSLFATRLTSTYGYSHATSSTLRGGGTYFIYGPHLAQPTAFRSTGGYGQDNARTTDYAWTHNQSVAYDGISIFSGAGELLTGLLSVYGLEQ